MSFTKPTCQKRTLLSEFKENKKLFEKKFALINQFVSIKSASLKMKKKDPSNYYKFQKSLLPNPNLSTPDHYKKQIAILERK